MDLAQIPREKPEELVVHPVDRIKGITPLVAASSLPRGDKEDILSICRLDSMPDVAAILEELDGEVN